MVRLQLPRMVLTLAAKSPQMMVAATSRTSVEGVTTPSKSPSVSEVPEASTGRVARASNMQAVVAVVSTMASK